MKSVTRIIFLFLDKPIFVDTAEVKITATEGEGKVIAVKAKGNPDSIKYKWSKNGSQLKTVTGKLQVEGASLNFTEVTRNFSGSYIIEASNSEGSTVQTIELDVQCK